jgi:cell division protein FtsL
MRLFRISNILSFAAATVCGVLLFWTSQAVQQKEEMLSDVRHKLMQETDTLRVLSVEWDYLNRPQRLEQLARDQLGMEQPSAKEVVRNVSDIPEPIIVGTDPDYYEEGIVQTVSMQQPVRKIAPPVPKETISPSKAEKQSFEKLIQNLSAEGDAQ